MNFDRLLSEGPISVTTIPRRTILAILGLLILGAVVAVVGPGLFSLSSNLCLESADEVRIESSVLEFSGDRGWSINAAAGCDNKIVGGTTTLPKDSISTDEASAERDFTLGLTSFDAWFYQGIRDTRSPVYTVRSAVFSDCGLFSGDECPNSQDDCDAFQAESSESSPAEFRYTDGSDLYCYKVERVGSVSDWTLAQGTDFDGTFTVEAAGRSDTDTISKDDVTARLQVADVNVDGDREHAHVTWTGSLAGELRSMDLSEFIATCENNCEQHTNEISWGVGAESQYSAYSAYDGGGFQSCVETEVDANGAPHTCVNAYNNRASNVFADASSGIRSFAGFDVADVRFQDGQIQVVADRGTAIDRPEFRILVDADWIGFSIPTVQPRFESVPDVTVIGNSQSTAAIDVRNTGETGEMQVFAECPSPISGGSDTAMVPSGETGRFFIPISAGPTETRDYTCTVTSQDTDTAETAQTTELTVHAKTSCPDGDGDGVCDQLDACPDEPGAGSNNGCPLEEVCGNDVDDDGDGRVDEGCEEPGGNWFENLFSGLPAIGGVGTGLDQLAGDLGMLLSGGGSWLAWFDVAFTVAIGLAVLMLVSTVLLNLFPTAEFVDLLPVKEWQFRLLVGIFFGVLAAGSAYAFVSSIVGKVLLLVVVGGAIGLYAYVESLVPG
ncbi:hypothetical protein [Halorarum salinum]|uniref:Fusexin 1 n=1 Tax=Halorarum salinum TaxID=2743089 RepID=A0A7D5QG64_9EURY|nr:hypothetical protein [Halobaculum salinum]QLG61983.1 hypothetical protein HUG12_09720 [Halobaculum salinum]